MGRFIILLAGEQKHMDYPLNILKPSQGPVIRNRSLSMCYLSASFVGALMRLRERIRDD